MERYQNPEDPLNGPQYHTGKPCIEKGCERPAGTAWGRFWCQSCNSARMNRIGSFLEAEVARYDAAQQATGERG
jgi:hypothetical protein